MPNNPKAKDNLKQFPAGESGNPKGRPKNVINQLGELVSLDFGLRMSKQDKYHALELMLERTVPELKKIGSKKDVPAFVVVVAKAILKDIETGKMVTMDSMLDRLFGKAKQEVVSNVNLKPVEGEKPDISLLTDEELETFHALLSKATPNQK